MIIANNQIYTLILFAIIFVGSIMYYKAMTAMIINRTISSHTEKASMDSWGLDLGVMRCIIKNPYKKDKKMSEYIRKARIAIGITLADVVLFFILSS